MALDGTGKGNGSPDVRGGLGRGKRCEKEGRRKK